MENKRGRPRLTHPKRQARLNVEYLHLLPELKTAISPRGLTMTDGQAVDVLIATMHELLVEKQGVICDPDKMVDFLNHHFKKTFSEFLVETLKGFGHMDVSAKWREDGSVTVTCDDGTAVVPAQPFEGERLDKDAILRELRPTGRVT